MLVWVFLPLKIAFISALQMPYLLVQLLIETKVEKVVTTVFFSAKFSSREERNLLEAELVCIRFPFVPILASTVQ